MASSSEGLGAFDPLIGLEVHVPASYLDQLSQNPDTVQAAIELGRLDFASALISIVGLLIAIFGLIGFFEVRSRAKRAAQVEARKEAKGALPELLPSVVESVLKKQPDILIAVLRDNPTLLGLAIARVEEARNLFYGDIDAEEAEDIAKTMEGGEDEDP